MTQIQFFNFPHQICNTHHPFQKTSDLVTLIQKRKSSNSTRINTSKPLMPVLRCSVSSVSAIESDTSNSARIFIKGLPQSIAEGFLIKTFSNFGKINRVKIITDKSSARSLGFAYLWFDNKDSAEFAVNEMDGKFFCGRFIAVTIAKPESPTRHSRITPYKF